MECSVHSSYQLQWVVQPYCDTEEHARPAGLTQACLNAQCAVHEPFAAGKTLSTCLWEFNRSSTMGNALALSAFSALKLQQIL